MNIPSINQRVLEISERKQIAKEVAQVSTEDILLSEQNFFNFINKGLDIINKGIEQPKQPEEKLKVEILELFKIITQLRHHFTGEEYYLLVETEAGNTIGTSLEKLFEKDELILKDGQIGYNLTKMQKELEAIEIYNELYKSLTNRLFPQICKYSEKNNFFYNSTEGRKIGHFFSDNFAHYKAGNTWAHYYIEDIIKENAEYTSETAKFYNRGHVYEWYLEDLNNESIGATTTEVDAQTFMRRHKKDVVPFLKAGDITVNKGEKIYAVQIKRFNNQKLITYTQIRTTLTTLKELHNKELTEKKMLKIIQEAFVNQEKDKPVEKPILDHVQKMTSDLYRTWSN